MNWFDVTDFSTWRGHMTGTQRVVYELARRANDEGTSRFMVYKDKKFVEINWVDIVEKIKISAQNDTNNARMHDQITRNKILAQKVFAILPKRVSSRITPEHKVFVKNTLHELRKLKGRRKIVEIAQTENSGIQFREGDRIIVLGKPWDDMGIVEFYKRLHVRQESVQIISLIYDLIPIHSPQLFGKPLPAVYAKFMFEACQYSSKIFCISKNTMNDLKKYVKDMNLPERNIEVIRLGDFHGEKKTSVRPNLQIEENEYILCVGTFEVRKNHQALYFAYKIAEQQGLVLPKVVVVGGRGWYVGDIEYLIKNDPYTNEKFIFANNTDDGQLEWLYENCIFTIYPSVYEGWGLPVAESLSHGKVCLSSSASSMPEISVEAEYFNPYDNKELFLKIISIMERVKNKNKKIKYTPVGWDFTYETLKISFL